MKINLQTNQNKFIIKTDSKVTSIYIKKGKKIYFEKQDDHFFLRASDIVNLVPRNIENQIKIFYTTQDKKAKQFYINEQIELNFLNHMTLTDRDQTITLYITRDGYLRFIINHIPYPNQYVSDGVLEKIDSEDGYFNIQIKTDSSFFPLETCTLILQNRKSQSHLQYHPDKIEQNVFGHQMTTHFIYKVKIVDIISLLDHQKFDTFDATVLDSFIIPVFTALNTVEKRFRIKRPQSINEETWANYQDHMMLLKNYGTIGAQNLAFRVSFLEHDAFSHYMNLKKQDLLQEKKVKDKKVILISEYPHKAQDNGLHLFNYLNDNYQDEFDCYYIISQKSKDIENLETYQDKVIHFKSLEHFEIIQQADIILHTHSPNYATPLMTEVVDTYYKPIKKIFLQHGIIGERDLSYLYSRKTNPIFTDKFIVSSLREKNIVKKELKYPEKDILMTGLARFDLLLEDNSPEESYALRKHLLIMPSWRRGQDDLSDEEFLKTPFFKEFNALLKDESLQTLINTENLTVSFYLHTNFQKYSHLFSAPHINILKEGQETVQNLLKKNGILITDYSSVGLDFSLLDRPVLYYQFDQQLQESRKKKKNFLPGPIFKSRPALIKALEEKTKNNTLSSKYKTKRFKNLYAYQDTKARGRIVNEIKKLLN